jgi:hypothetical protein
MKKVYLIKYEMQQYQALSYHILATFDLTIKTVWFGLFEITKVVEYDVPMHNDLKSFIDNWDRLITTKARIK